MKLPMMMGGLLGAGALAFAGYWQLSRFDRWATEATTSFYLDEEKWALLRAHPHEPRVIAGAQRVLRLGDISGSSQCDIAFESINKRVGPILDAHPTVDDESLKTIAIALRVCGEVRMMRWTTRPSADWLGALKANRAGLSPAPGAMVRALEQLEPPVGQSLIDLVVADLDDSGNSAAEAHLRAGFPADGAPFVPAGEPVPRTDPKSDPRLILAWGNWLRTGCLVPNGCRELGAMARVGGWLHAQVPLDEKVLATLVQGYLCPQTAALARLVVRATDVAFIRLHAPAHMVAALLGALGTGSTMGTPVPSRPGRSARWTGGCTPGRSPGSCAPARPARTTRHWR